MDYLIEGRWSDRVLQQYGPGPAADALGSQVLFAYSFSFEQGPDAAAALPLVRAALDVSRQELIGTIYFEVDDVRATDGSVEFLIALPVIAAVGSNVGPALAGAGGAISHAVAGVATVGATAWIFEGLLRGAAEKVGAMIATHVIGKIKGLTGKPNEPVSLVNIRACAHALAQQQFGTSVPSLRFDVA